MFKQTPFLFSLLVMFVLLSLHATGSYFSWYWSYPWFDIIVHLVGGLWVGLITLWLASCLGQIKSLSEFKIKSLIIAILSATLIGLLWELTEIFTQMTSLDADGYIINTIGDLLNSAIGGILAYLYFIRNRKSFDQDGDLLHPFYSRAGIIKH